jgi:hypothetical protein
MWMVEVDLDFHFFQIMSTPELSLWWMVEALLSHLHTELPESATINVQYYKSLLHIVAG